MGAARYNAPMRTLLLLPCFLVPLLAQPQSLPPFPTTAIKRNPPEQATAEAQKRVATDTRGTEQSPIVVRVLPSTKSQDQPYGGKARELDQSSVDWWMVRLTGAIAFISLVQTTVFGLQARRLKQTIQKMDAIASQQTQDVQASIAEATRAAQAMERISESMANSTESVRESVNISRDIADRQKLITELQSRGYLTIAFESMVPQNPAAGLRFAPHMRLENRGSTPAYNIRFATSADVLPFPLADDFAFPLPAEPPYHSGTIGPGLHKILSAVVPKQYTDTEAGQIESGSGQRIVAWGIVKYQDAFTIERSLLFGFTHIRVGEHQWMAYDTTKNNYSD